MGLLLVALVRAQPKLGPEPVCDWHLKDRVSGGVGHFVHQALEAMAPPEAHEAAAVAVRIEVGHEVLPERLGVIFHPFRGANEALLLRIPGGVHDRAIQAVSLGC